MKFGFLVREIVLLAAISILSKRFFWNASYRRQSQLRDEIASEKQHESSIFGTFVTIKNWVKIFLIATV